MSLLDSLIKTEESPDETDPLDGFGNIGETVMGQLNGTIGLEEPVINSFGGTMGHSNFEKRSQKRQHTGIETNATKKFYQSDLEHGFTPRLKFDKKHMDFFNEGQPTSFKELHEKLEKDRSKQFEEQLSKDVDRLLQSANRIYGEKEWSPEEKTEFTAFCRKLKSGKLSDEDKKQLNNFYSKAYEKKYQEKMKEGTANNDDVKDMLATRSAVRFPVKLGVVPKDYKLALREEDIKTEKGEKKPVEANPSGTLDLSSRINPALKYEAEKEFRIAANDIFVSVYLKFEKETLSFSQRRKETLRKEVSELIPLINQYMADDNKKWNEKDTQLLGNYYEMFLEKMNFTIMQSKELGTFLRKVFGKLEKYEIERENNTALQEKRKYWQEYKTMVPPNQGKQGRRSLKFDFCSQSKAEVEKRVRKAAYLRQWRIAQKEKQSQSPEAPREEYLQPQAFS